MPSLTVPTLPDISVPSPADLSLPDPGRLVPPKRSLPATQQLAQELSIAALLGGNLFGRVAMHPALAQIVSPAERGKVVNGAWRRYGVVNSLALAGLVAGWLPERSRRLGAVRVGARERALVHAKDAALGAVLVTGVASAVSGIAFAHEAPEGAVPLADGQSTAPQTPAPAARLKHVVNALSALNLVAEVAFVACDAAFTRRRPRWLPSA